MPLAIVNANKRPSLTCLCCGSKRVKVEPSPDDETESCAQA
jgi:hypothetical protein